MKYSLEIQNLIKQVKLLNQELKNQLKPILEAYQEKLFKEIKEL